MKVTITLMAKGADGSYITREYQHVKDTGLAQGGLYTLQNRDGNVIAQFPLGVVLAVDMPEHDTNISLVA